MKKLFFLTQNLIGQLLVLKNEFEYMCGFVACFYKKSFEFSKDDFINSLDQIHHRGPDSTGYMKFDIGSNTLALGHKRLSIIDLNNSGNQPMMSSSKRFTILFNGEIYNHQILRKTISDFLNYNWKGSCDTETLVNLFELYDDKKAITKISGQFALLIYDHKKNVIKIVRDRAGEKPLYVCLNNEYIGFSSDLIAFRKFPKFNSTISHEALSGLLKFNYIPSPLSIFKNCFKIPSGSIIEIDLNIFLPTNEDSFERFLDKKGVIIKKYWSNYNFLNNKFIAKNLKEIDYQNNLEHLLSNSVKEQLISDVPLGAFLSGGVDSSLIVALMQQHKNNNKTYNIGFDFNYYDESKYAKEVANILGTEHTSHIFSKDDILKLISFLPQAYSEPFADSSSLPTLLVSKLASQNVKVALSGDGGDELFGGYNRYLYAHKYWKFFSLTPRLIKKYICKGLLNTNDKIFSFFIKDIYKYQKIIKKIQYIEDEYSFFDSLISEWKEDTKISKFLNDENNSIDKNIFRTNNNLKFEEKMMFIDFNTYLPDDILCKVDRASMFFSLECRAPYLNKDLIEFSYNLPLKYKINKGQTKYLLKKILSKYLPDKLINRPKKGFGIPLGEWMKKDLREWTCDNLSQSVCNKHNLFNFETLNETLLNHLNGKQNNEHRLWSILQFNQWYHKYIN